MKNNRFKPMLLNNNFLNFIPLICSLMVIQIHSYNIGTLPKTALPSLIISFFSHGLCTAAVPIFFFISGYLFFRNVDSIQSLLMKQKKRVITVFLPFIAWSSFYFLVYVVGDKFLPIINTTVDLSVLGILKAVFFYQYSFPLWYMFQLCVFIILSVLIFYILRNKYLSLFILLASIIVGMFVVPSIDIYIGDLKRSIFQVNFFAYYLFGCILAKSPEITNLILVFARKINIILPIFAFLIFGFIESLFFEGILTAFNTRCMVPFVFISFLILSLKMCETQKVLPKCKVSTMVIYGIHSFVGLILGKLFLSNFNMPILLAYFMGTVLTFMCSFGIGFVLKYLKPIYYIFSGNR